MSSTDRIARSRNGGQPVGHQREALLRRIEAILDLDALAEHALRDPEMLGRARPIAGRRERLALPSLRVAAPERHLPEAARRRVLLRVHERIDRAVEILPVLVEARELQPL